MFLLCERAGVGRPRTVVFLQRRKQQRACLVEGVTATSRLLSPHRRSAPQTHGARALVWLSDAILVSSRRIPRPDKHFAGSRKAPHTTSDAIASRSKGEHTIEDELLSRFSGIAEQVWGSLWQSFGAGTLREAMHVTLWRPLARLEEIAVPALALWLS